MKRKEDPAEKLLTRKPSAETNLREDGFLSVLYQPDADVYPGKALTRLIAEQYTDRGLTVLALAYWAKEGLPTAICHIPLEYAEKAALWLKNRGYEKIAMAGVSMGAEYALLCGCSFPDLISCVAAISPISVSTQGLQKKNAWHKKTKLLEGAAFSLRGKDLPFEKLDFDKKQILKDSLRGKEICMRSCYEKAAAGKHAEIPAEKITGPVLLLAADRDSMWPAAESAEKLLARRNETGLITQYGHYAYASHLLLPCQLKSRRMFRLERQFPEKCWQSNLDAFQKTLSFLRNIW